MRYLSALALTLWAVFAPFTMADEVVYVTDMDVFPLLAPCAASALSYAIQDKTYSTCDENETQLQSCICSNTELSRDVAFTISTALSVSCGTDGSAQELTSVEKVYSKYCDPEGPILTFSTPRSNIVNAYITDLAEMAYMPPCAQSALEWAVMGEPSSYCPEAASLYAPCVCNKDYVVSSISETISKSVRYSCSNNQDITSAQNFYHEYCNMNNGTTEFALPPGPPGDMTYYVTALEQYRDLNSCAQSGVENAIMSQASWLCGEGPQALASCICLKSGMLSLVSSSLTSEVKWYCENTATDEVSSAMEVLDFYCSAAKGDVVATVTESIAETYATAESRTNAGGSSPSETGPADTPDPTETNGGAGSDGDNGNQDGSESGSSSSSTNGDDDGGGIGKPALIAAVVLGVVVGLILIAALIWFIRRKNLKAKAAAASATNEPSRSSYQPYGGRPELVGSEANESRVNMASSASPRSMDHPYGKPELLGMQVNELPPQQGFRTELQGEGITGGYGMPYGQPPQELASPGGYPVPYGHQQQMYQQQHGQPPHQLQHQLSVASGRTAGTTVEPSPISPPYAQPPYQHGWQSGPVESYEMDTSRR